MNSQLIARPLLTMAILSAMLLPAAGAPPPPPVKPESVGISSERLKRIHEMVMTRVGEGAVSGAVTVVARQGKVVHFEAHGVMNLESKKPMAKDSLFRLASTTKPVTTVAILMLMEEGKLLLTDPVSKFVPEFKGSRVAMAGQAAGGEVTTVPANREITIFDLLTHGSGLGSGGAANAEFLKVMKQRQSSDTLADFIPKLGAVPLDFQPGTEWRYSGGAGFDTLGRIVEITSGLKFDEFLQKRLFAPLGMNSTWFNVPESESGRRVTIYRRTANGLEKLPAQPAIGGLNYPSGAGGLTSTVGDSLKFAQMLANGGVLEGKRFLSPWTVDLMMSNNVGDLFNGKSGRPPQGVGFGLGGEVVVNAVEAKLRKPNGTYGWDGAFGTYWTVNRREQLVTILFIQTPGRSLHFDFDNAVAQAVIE
jgi:CubicO group peptidase (beta-lactamase class C family)